ncbi:MAG: c-type cytochrome [Gemmataceae bacterium]|nr:c-type cytochrome [Gemmataceae bacterium]
MTRSRLFFSCALLLCGLAVYHHLGAQGTKSQTQWIWFGVDAKEDQTVYFRKEIVLKQRITSARLYGTCDNKMTVYINDKPILSSDNWESPIFREVTSHFSTKGKLASEQRCVVAVKAQNSDGPAGLLLRLELQSPKGGKVIVSTDDTWRATEQAAKGWTEPGFDDSAWAKATVLAPLGGGPWARINEGTLTGAAKFKKPTATPIELIKVKKDFKVEHLYSVPKETQGSWVSLCADDKGRLIASDQYGKIFRITPPPIGGSAEDTKVEALPVDLGEAHGLCWAFDSLYVVVNEGRNVKPRGLWRVRSSKGDDVLDTKEHLRTLDGSGEHGPHAVILGPDRNSLYVCCGNHTKMTKLASTTVPLHFKEDYLVPRMWDASGHAVGILAPGGCTYKTDRDGKNWELISMGYRNHYDIAFNKYGDMFTYDSDMEWFMNLPFYRPTRVMHAVPGSDFGWRSGTATMTVGYPDNLPSTVDIGPGSPTGVTFGYGAKFPVKYQEAFFICDWSYGKLYAVHLKAEGASYVGEAEEFMNGSPLPLTDIAVNPVDGAMYFAIGGRNTMSGLYRITYVGKEPTQSPAGTEAMPSAVGTRQKLESYYNKKDPQAIDVAWPHLANKDRFVRYAARLALEFQDPATWQEKALKESNPIALTHALLGLTRAGDKSLQPRILEALERIDWSKLTPAQKVDVLRVYELAFIRMGAPDATWKERVGKRLDAFYPSPVREVNVELSRVLAYLETPGVVAKSLALQAKAPTQEEQIDYALSLRIVKSGWTKEEREKYFNWFHKAATYRGHNSFHGFMRNIRADAVKSLSEEERTALKEVLANVPQPQSPKFTFKERAFVKKWEVDELAPVVEKGLVGRDFDKGRNLFGETKCFACHRFNNEGGGTGPDLTGVIGRFNARDLLESLIDPNKTISDQYAAIVVTTTDDRLITGRIVNLAGDGIHINTDMLDPNKIVTVNRNLIASIGPSKVSLMPSGLLDTLNRDEILDLVAYLYSRGDRNHRMFARP